VFLLDHGDGLAIAVDHDPQTCPLDVCAVVSGAQVAGCALAG
jgi:hypothetical protein